MRLPFQCVNFRKNLLKENLKIFITYLLRRKHTEHKYLNILITPHLHQNLQAAHHCYKAMRDPIFPIHYPQKNKNIANLLILLGKAEQQNRQQQAMGHGGKDAGLGSGDQFKSSDINLNGQILRIQAYACQKQIPQIWHLDQSEICNFFQQYINLPLSRIRSADLFEMEGSRIVKNQNKIYLGQVVQKQKHGKGIAVYRDGRIYEGEFYCNEKNGFGCELYSNGNLYIGHFSQNKKHGKGSFYWFSLCTPACTKDSAVKIEQYHGDWWGGLPDGEGEHQKSNGDFYIGAFKNGLKHGNGVEYYGNGDLYKGQYINGLAEGFGEYQWKSKAIYKGDFKQGYRNGYGTWESGKGSQNYKGHYLLDRKHGYGIYDWGNGKVYKGNYIEDMRTGEGELYENDKLIYAGLWENGEQLQKYASPNEKEKMGRHSSSKFRVKTSRIKYQTTKREFSASTVKRNNFQINFKHDDNPSTHRGCVACRKRPRLHEYAKQINPQDSY